MIEIKLAQKEQVPFLAEIEREAAGIFNEVDLPAHLRTETVPEKDHFEAVQQGLLITALREGGVPVGYALTRRAESFLHLAQIDVHPEYQQNGIGSRLLDEVSLIAGKHECTDVVLTTFQHIPWNAPWYEAKGFRILRADETPSYLAQILLKEKEMGLAFDRRVAMTKSVDSG